MSRSRSRRQTALVPSGSLVQRPPGDQPGPYEVFCATCSPNSRATMCSRLDAAARILKPGMTAATFPWPALNHLAVLGVLAHMRERKQAKATIDLTRAALRKMAKVLFRMRLLDVEERMRIDDIEPPKGKRLLRGRALDEKEVRKLFAACRRDPSAAGRRDAALLACLYGGGLRRGEASALDVADLHANALRVEGKGGRERMQPIGDDAMSAIAAWLRVRGDWAGPLFVTVSKAGKIGRRRLRGPAIDWKVKRLAHRAALPATSPHDLRRTFVTTLLEAGEDLGTVSKAAGHVSLSTTSIYDRRGEKAVAAAVARLPVPFKASDG